jgi:hypothetical protein
MSLPEFDPEDCAVVFNIEDRGLRPALPEEALMHGTAWAVPIAEDGEAQTEELAYGSVEWTHVGYGAAIEAGCSPREAAEPHEQLLSLHEALFDEKDNLRGELGVFSSGTARDLLLIDRVDASEGQDLRAVASELIEHLLIHFTGGCFGAAYIDDFDPRPEIHELLTDLGFERREEDDWVYFFLDLRLRRASRRRKNPKSDPTLQ